MASPAVLAEKLLGDLCLTHVPGLKKKCMELGLSRRQVQTLHREKDAASLAAVEEALRGDFGREIAAAVVSPKTHGNCQEKRPRLADLAPGADGSFKAARVDRPDAASTSAAHDSDRISTDGDRAGSDRISTDGVLAGSNVQNGNGERGESEEDAGADRSPKAATEPGSPSSFCPNDVEQVIQALKTQLPEPFWPPRPDRLQDWMPALERYHKTLQQIPSDGAPRACCAEAHKARAFVLVDEVPMCRKCFLRRGHTGRMVVHMDGARARCGAIVPEAGASTEAAHELEVAATALMELIRVAEAKSGAKKNLANGNRLQVRPSPFAWPSGLRKQRTGSTVACAAFVAGPGRGGHAGAGGALVQEGAHV